MVGVSMAAPASARPVSATANDPVDILKLAHTDILKVTGSYDAAAGKASITITTRGDVPPRGPMFPGGPSWQLLQDVGYFGETIDGVAGELLQLTSTVEAGKAPAATWTLYGNGESGPATTIYTGKSVTITAQSDALKNQPLHFLGRGTYRVDMTKPRFIAFSDDLSDAMDAPNPLT